MKITVNSSKAVKPDNGGAPSSAASHGAVPLTVFDKVNYEQYISGINFFRPPSSPPNAVLEAGLARALAEYREWAGRLGVIPGDGNGGGRRAILLNDAGARFVEATADVALDSVMPIEPTPAVLSLHPSGDDGADELLLVQVTRFACGSIAVGHTMHHAVGDGRAACNFLLAWGQASRGAAFDPVPAHDRASLFRPREPPLVQFQHRGVEFRPLGETKPRRSGGHVVVDDDDEVVVQRVRFSREFVSELRSRASAGAARPYSTLQCVVAHLWRCMTKARRLDAPVVTTLRVAVDGRMRLRRHPRVPDGYTGNAVLWARPSSTAGELLSRPLGHAAELIAREVARIDEGYFGSFIDFASSSAVEEEGLVTTADGEEMVYTPDLEVDSLLHAPFYDMDFGSGPPFFFMPSYLPVEGAVFLARSFSGDSSVDAYVPLFSRAMDTFRKCCYSLAMADARL